jgi:stalled ribosome rescue protein Dom34
MKFIQKLDDSIKDCTKEFIQMMDEMLERYREDESIVFDSVGITKKDYYRVCFTKMQFLKALDFYLKERRREFDREMKLGIE